MDEELQTFLRRIETRLEDISQNTRLSWTALLWDGMLRGAGFLIGSVVIVALLGGILSFLGLIPGFSHVVQYLSAILHAHVPQLST